MLDINETDQSAIVKGGCTTFPGDILYPNEDTEIYIPVECNLMLSHTDICISNLQKSESGLTPEEEYQFCHMVCTEDKNAEICSILIESDNQII
ncbi:MAG: hypothetical protein U0X86_001395 [Wolbachia endosymbiont of Xenopsylla cheopis]